jgi:hypothetical protein
MGEKLSCCLFFCTSYIHDPGENFINGGRSARSRTGQSNAYLTLKEERYKYRTIDTLLFKREVIRILGLTSNLFCLYNILIR